MASELVTYRDVAKSFFKHKPQIFKAMDKAVAAGVLKWEEHMELVGSLDTTVSKTGLHGLKFYIWESATNYCGPSEINFIKSVMDQRPDDLNGLDKPFVFYTSIQPHDWEPNLMAMGSVFVRRFIPVDYISIHDLVKIIKEDMGWLPRVLIIPDFAVPKEGPATGDRKFWFRDLIYSYLLRRKGLGLATVVVGQGFGCLTRCYGEDVKALFVGGGILVEGADHDTNKN